MTADKRVNACGLSLEAMVVVHVSVQGGDHQVMVIMLQVHQSRGW